MIIDRWDYKAAYAALGVDQNASKLAASLGLRDRLAEAQNWKCCYCGVLMNRWRDCDTLATIEHVIPASAGGRVCWETCAAACKKCNQADGDRLTREWHLPLTVPVCRWCGSADIRMVGWRVIKCRDCNRQFSAQSPETGPFSVVPFGALRRAAGEMIVANATVDRIADRLRRKFFSINFMPMTLAATLMDLATPAIERAQANSECQVEVYNAAVTELREKYTPKTAAAPERGPLPGVENA